MKNTKIEIRRKAVQEDGELDKVSYTILRYRKTFRFTPSADDEWRFVDAWDLPEAEVKLLKEALNNRVDI